jgi:predicted TIM-barrel fold metal-dependent hydrolase
VADRSFVLGLYSLYMEAEIPTADVVAYVRKFPGKLIGIAGVDPMADDLSDRLAQVVAEPALGGVTICPACQGYHPSDSRAWRLYEFCCENSVPVIVHHGTHFRAASKLEYARPVLWDEVLRDYPALRMVVSHMAHPWEAEMVAMLGKHEHLYADVAGLIRRPWTLYAALSQAHEFRVIDKLLFGSDYPFLTAGEAIECIYRLNEMVHGTHLPPVPREELRSIVERDALAALGMSPVHGT